MAMSFGSVHALAYDNAGVLKRTAAYELDRKRFPNRLRAVLPVNRSAPRDPRTAPSAATGPLARVRPTTSARLPGLIVETSPASAKDEDASAHFSTAKSVDASRPTRVAATTRPSGRVT